MRRVGVLALLVTSLVVVAPSRVSATVTVEAEPVARKAVTSSPQTTGPGGTLSWGLDRIDQRTAVTSNRSYSFLTNGTGVNIYVLDSGVAGNHPEFGARVLNGWSYRSSSTALASYNSALSANQQNPQTGIEACPNDGTHATNPLTFDNPAQPDMTDVGRTDNDGHGTHVAGIAAGDSVGVAKNANIIPVRALDSCGNGTRTMILRALAWILADHDSNEKAVLNLSVGFGEQVSEVDNAIISLMNEGIVVAAAAGNSSTSACGSTPASTTGTISVGSMSISDVESDFSNYGDCVDMFAPGSSIASAYPYLAGMSNTYASLSGTSMATPFVTGAIARYLQTVGSAPTTFSTGPTAAWSWLSTNATPNMVNYRDVCRAVQTPNSALFIPANSGIQQPVVPAVVSSLVVLPTGSGAVVSWANGDPNSSFRVVANVSTPCSGTQVASCFVQGGSSCTLIGLTSGVSYTVTVTQISFDGGSAPARATVVVGTPPEAPSIAVAQSGNAAITVAWAASPSPGATYVVTSNPPSAGCTTTATSCLISGLKNGVNYTFSVSTTSATGLQSVTSATTTARPGFVVKKSTVKRGSRTLFSSIMTTPSKGKKTWSETGPCSISSGRLVAPKRKTTCLLKLSVAKYGSYPKMSTTLKVTVP